MPRDEAALASESRVVGTYNIDFDTFEPGAAIVVEYEAGTTGTVALTAQARNPITDTVDTTALTGISIAAFSGVGEVRKLICYPGIAAVADQSVSASLAGGVRLVFTVATATVTFSAYVRSIS